MNRLKKLLTEGKYSEAVMLFDEIKTYEDSSKMAMYGRAIASAESGDYEAAFSSFSALGDYKDCPLMLIYYKARQYEFQATSEIWELWNEAASTYDSIGLFLDSKDRADNCRKKIYDEAVNIAKDFDTDDSYKFINAVLDKIGKDEPKRA